MVVRVVHISTAHGRNELRVHLKECNSLATAGYDVHYIVADGLGEELINRVNVHDIGVAGGRFQRMIVSPWRMLHHALSLNASLYHFHDPELLLIALFLFKKDSKVIYDSHEDVPRSLMSRTWIPKLIRKVLSYAIEKFEDYISSRLSAVVAATPHIAERFRKLNPITITVNNYPLKDEIGEAVTTATNRYAVCYLGAIGRLRGIEEMIRSLEHVNVSLILAGRFESEMTLSSMQKLPGWKKVDYRGFVNRKEITKIMSESIAGLIFIHPEPNHIHAQPNKMFEYMSAGLPVLASNFPLWEQQITESGCGLTANPLDPLDIARVINRLLIDQDLVVSMGKRGRQCVLDEYNWDNEEKKLLLLYSKLLGEY